MCHQRDFDANCEKCKKRTRHVKCPKCNGRGKTLTTHRGNCGNTRSECENGQKDRFHP